MTTNHSICGAGSGTICRCSSSSSSTTAAAAAHRPRYHRLCLSLSLSVHRSTGSSLPSGTVAIDVLAGWQRRILDAWVRWWVPVVRQATPVDNLSVEQRPCTCLEGLCASRTNSDCLVALSHHAERPTLPSRGQATTKRRIVVHTPVHLHTAAPQEGGGRAGGRAGRGICQHNLSHT
jgi:hypothetical protein